MGELTGRDFLRIAEWSAEELIQLIDLADELKVGGGQVQAHSAELEDADLERDACAGGRLLKDHPQSAAGEEVVLLAPGLPFLEVVGQVERL